MHFGYKQGPKYKLNKHVLLQSISSDVGRVSLCYKSGLALSGQQPLKIFFSETVIPGKIKLTMT